MSLEIFKWRHFTFLWSKYSLILYYFIIFIFDIFYTSEFHVQLSVCLLSLVLFLFFTNKYFQSSNVDLFVILQFIYLLYSLFSLLWKLTTWTDENNAKSYMSTSICLSRITLQYHIHLFVYMFVRIYSIHIATALVCMLHTYLLLFVY